MESGSRLRIALFSLLGVILLVLSIWGIISITRSIFKPAPTQPTTQKATLSEYARSGTAVKLQVGGPIVGNDRYVSYQIEVTDTQRVITTYASYQNTLTSSKTYTNNSEAYRVFLRALERESFLTKLRNSTDTDDGTAACSQGKRYAYILTDKDDVVSRLWNTSCSAKQGTAGGDTPTIRALFKSQITDFSTIITGPYSVLL